jgi:hypothetical protein
MSRQFGKKQGSPITHLCGIKTYRKYLHTKIL